MMHPKGIWTMTYSPSCCILRYCASVLLHRLRCRKVPFFLQSRKSAVDREGMSCLTFVQQYNTAPNSRISGIGAIRILKILASI